MNNKDLKFLVESETLKIVHEILGIKNNSQELDMQDATASSIKNRGVATVEKNPKKAKFRADRIKFFPTSKFFMSLINLK
jgi:hypothetical protein